ncbi:MAG: patatin-like phospholipase family protein [Desulfobacterales bacterium]
MPSMPAAPKKPVNLALQGGGAHGAFTWGVLDRLLDDRRLEIEAISGTSAGAMNAVVAADGIMKGGSKGAQAALEAFWKAVSSAALATPYKRTLLDMISGNWNLDHSPGYLFTDFLSRVASPYDLNPFNLNPLRDFLVEQVNFERVRCCNKLKLFIAATSVQTGKVRIFDRSQLTPDVVMASACLPQMFQAVTIQGEDFWDGGFSGNPPLHPFAYHCTAPDVIIVQINPLGCRKTPKLAREILNRVNEITFNANLLSELRAIEFVSRLLDEGNLDPKRYKKMLIHAIEAENGFQNLNASSKLNAEWEFLVHLHDIGRKVADAWLEANVDAIGEHSTLDLKSLIH